VLSCVGEESRAAAIFVAILFGLNIACLVVLMKNPKTRWNVKHGCGNPQKESGKKCPFYWLMIVDSILMYVRNTKGPFCFRGLHDIEWHLSFHSSVHFKITQADGQRKVARLIS
jgi:hypothetical protein